MNHDPMTARLSAGLSAWQVATLLVSASYGIGFLFGSGEVALQWGMAGSIYAMVTALGIAVLAFAAPRLWRSGLQIWQVLGAAYGAKASTLVAVLCHRARHRHQRPLSCLLIKTKKSHLQPLPAAKTSGLRVAFLLLPLSA